MAKRTDTDNLSLFDDIFEVQEAPSSKIDVVKLNYVSAESLTWQELFAGFNELY